MRDLGIIEAFRNERQGAIASAPPLSSFPKSFIGNPNFFFFFGFSILWTPA